MARKISTTQYLKEAILIHGDLYDYSDVVYTRAHDLINIKCPKHGIFRMRAYSHLSKQGCPLCAHTVPLTIREVRRRSSNRFGDKYEVVDFVSSKRPMTIKCKHHTVFTIPVAETHWRGKDGGCPQCAMIKRMDALKPGKISYSETVWLDSIGVPIRQHRVQIEDKTFIVDGFDPAKNIIYEYYGAYWHGNPQNFNMSDYNKVLNMTFGQLYQKTIDREKLLIKNGYILVVKWEDCGKIPTGNHTILT